MKSTVGIWGLGESGVGAALLAKKWGYDLILVADKPPAPNYAARLHEEGLTWQVTSDPASLLSQVEWVVRSPGIHPNHQSLRVLQERGVTVFSDLEWGWRHFPASAQLWLVTGSSGKSSTTSLLNHMLRTAGRHTVACGNIGYSFCAALSEPTVYEYYVVEASSFQLWDTFSLIPHLAVITSLVPNHIDWHGSLSAYAEAKLRFVERLPSSSHLLYDFDSQLLNRWLESYKIQAQIWRYSFHPSEGIVAWIEKDKLICDMKTNGDTERWEISYEGTPLEELPQRKNSLAAAIAGRLMGLRRADLRRSFETLEKMPHRMERVEIVEGVLYVNDSKATTTDAVWYAMQSFERPIIWIAGGVDKGNDWGELLDIVRARVKALILIGQDPEPIYRAFCDTVPVIERAKSMKEAVEKAHALARPDDVVLLSPGCASFDWFRSYEERGNAFKEAVRNLKSAQAS
ncbi:MAG: UDP-N-acetylmuramoyl-L-alanine--D-glutamate ligase [Bacteroidia bacterium]|nr:UDP-N-acetylmuramoyl-L-alanine--D-glutamate ligase [Bacteroidia bacterium]MDW8015790.1 UDP-N-acetylmuramoyl-L-alanine--D-glutamate ligase [Bacteroidia bacterium]